MSRKYFDKYYGSYEITSLGPKRLLKTKIFETKAFHPVKKIFWPIFSRIIKYDKPQGPAFRVHKVV